MITLKRVTWNDCFSYGANNYIDLNDSTITQIIGVNGSGKSSIPLIIEEVLFNKNSKSITKGDIPNRNTTEDSYKIAIDFDIDQNSYNLIVERKSNVRVKLYENGIDISSHTATNTFKTITELFGMDFKTMSQLFYQSTNTSLQFLTATDTSRKKFLIDLLHLEEYVENFDTFKDAVKDVSLKVSGIQGKLDTVQKWLDSNKLETTDVLPLLEIDISISEDEIKLKRFMEEIGSIADKNRKISMNNDNKLALSKINISEIQGINCDPTISYDTEQSQVGAYKSELTMLNKSIDKLTKLGDQCPTCEQPIEASFKNKLLEDDRLKVSDLTQKMRELEIKIAAIQTNNNLYAKKTKAQKEWEELYRSIDKNLPDTMLDKEELEASIISTKSIISSAKKQIEAIKLENEKRNIHNTRIQVVEEQSTKFKNELEEASIALAVESERLAGLEILKKSFSTNGLIAYKIENLVKDLEDLTNTYLAELSDGRFTIEFVVTNDKLNVEITDFSKPVNILSLSTGELGRVNTATLLAIRKLMAKNAKNQLNVLFLDEVISTLDDAGKERLVEVLLEEDLNTFIVSHGWSHPLLSKLEIIKDSSGVSRIER